MGGWSAGRKVPSSGHPAPTTGNQQERSTMTGTTGKEEGSDLKLEPHGSARPGLSGTGPSAVATGHGLMRMGPPRAALPAFKQFMLALREPLERAGSSVSVSTLTGWVKITSLDGHKIYIAKTVTGVSRVESTLPPELIPGAQPPDPSTRPNGRIASWIPARPEVVARALGIRAAGSGATPAP